MRALGYLCLYLLTIGALTAALVAIAYAVGGSLGPPWPGLAS